jgi:hypothetical protein
MAAANPRRPAGTLTGPGPRLQARRAQERALRAHEARILRRSGQASRRTRVWDRLAEVCRERDELQRMVYSMAEVCHETAFGLEMAFYCAVMGGGDPPEIDTASGACRRLFEAAKAAKRVAAANSSYTEHEAGEDPAEH